MLIEHIAKGRYILDLGDAEERDITKIALGFYKCNRSKCLRKMIEAGIAVYNDLITEGNEHDNQLEDSMKIITENLIEESIEYDKDVNFGSVIESND